MTDAPNLNYTNVGHAYERTTACNRCGASVTEEMHALHDQWHVQMEATGTAENG